MDEQIADIRFGSDGLVPVVVQDASDGTVLMLVEMNREALVLTLQTGSTHAWSRPQQRLYKPGEDSGRAPQVVDVKHSDGGDMLLIQVSCGPEKTGLRSHFSRSLASPTSLAGDAGDSDTELPTVTEMPAALYDLILSRREAGDEKSYVHSLFRRGQDVICKKVVEEAAEVVIASKNQAPDEMIYEMADLWFHATVLLGYHTIHPHEVWRELQRRFGRPGGGKILATETPVAASETDAG
jgi:phosphoribosyl-ATP pyrophosphohydrolase/phosphoribosyl-AMP cyclohydrolase